MKSSSRPSTKSKVEQKGRVKKTQPQDRDKNVRDYDNSLRAEKSRASQKQIIEALVELLVERKGGDVTFDEVSEKSGVSVRSIYRFFNDKESLHQAMDKYLFSYLDASNELLAQMDVPDFGKHVYEVFDRHENMVLAYLYSPFGRNARVHFRKKLNAALVLKILEKKKIVMNVENGKKLAVIVSLVNAKIWHDIRQDSGYSGADMGPSISWALKTLIDAL